jgi:hypothetical protein
MDTYEEFRDDSPNEVPVYGLLHRSPGIQTDWLVLTHVRKREKKGGEKGDREKKGTGGVTPVANVRGYSVCPFNACPFNARRMASSPQLASSSTMTRMANYSRPAALLTPLPA